MLGPIISSSSADDEEIIKPLEGLELYLQLEYRDLNGNLYAFLEDPNPLLLADAQIVHEMMDNSTNVHTINGYDVLFFRDQIHYEIPTLESLTLFSHPTDTNIDLFISIHDGISILSGDTITATLRVVRSVDF